MKKIPTYKLVAICVVIGGIVGLGLLSLLLNQNGKKRDPIIVKYNDAINEIAADTDTYHATEEVLTLDVNGKELYREYNEYYNTHKSFLIISNNVNSIYHTFANEEHSYGYEYYLDGSEESSVHKNDGGAGYFARPFYNVSETYFFITDKNVSYEETEDQYIVTYVDSLLDKKGYLSNGETIQNLCDSAVSVCYFDKEWNVQKIVLTEEWRSIMEDGTETLETEITTITFLETSDEEIEKRLEEEYELLESLLK